jgi:hypothetical protein
MREETKNMASNDIGTAQSGREKRWILKRKYTGKQPGAKRLKRNQLLTLLIVIPQLSKLGGITHFRTNMGGIRNEKEGRSGVKVVK